MLLLITDMILIIYKQLIVYSQYDSNMTVIVLEFILKSNKYFQWIFNKIKYYIKKYAINYLRHN